jgi:hypothetical protein
MRSAIVMLSFAVVAGVSGLVVTAQPPTTSTTTTSVTTAPTSTPVSPNAFAPIAYFEMNCARCHGPYGTAYGAEFGKHLSNEQLARVVDDMAAGPGNAPVDATQLAILVEYHKAMIARQPFLAVTKAATSNEAVTVEGEVTPDSTVTVGETAATIAGTTWTVTVPKAPLLSIVARAGSATQTITFSPPE